MKENRKGLFLVLLLCAGAIFALDYQTPLGLAVWALYLIPLILAHQWFRSRLSAVVVGLRVLFTVAGLFFSPPGAPAWMAASNRAAGVVLFVAVSSLMKQRQEMLARLEKKRERLRISDERLGLAAAVGRVGIFDWDFAARRAWCSDGYFRVMGLGVSAEQEVTFEEWRSLLHPADRQRVLTELDMTVRGAGACGSDYRIVTSDGETRWISYRGQVFYDAAGQPVRMLGTVQDITERKRTEEALRESENRFRQLAESLPQLVWTCQADGACDYLSPQWIAYTGVPEAAHLGYGWLEQLHPDDRRPVIDRWREANAAGHDFDTEFRIRRGDGIYRWFRTRAVPLRDGEGAVIKWFGTNTDIEELKQAEQVLLHANEELDHRVRQRTAELRSAIAALSEELISRRQAEAFSRSVLSSLSANIAVIDRHGTIVAVNDSWARFAAQNGPRHVASLGVGVNYLEVCRRSAANDESVQRVLAGLEAVRNGECACWTCEYGCHSSSERRWFLMRATPLGNGREGVVIAHEDISELKRTEEALRQSKRELAESFAEREELSRDLHDSTIQSLFAIGMSLEECHSLIDENPRAARQRLDAEAGNLRQVIKEVRRHLVSPASFALDATDFIGELQSLSHQATDRRQYAIHLDVDAATAKQLTREQATHLYFIVREAVSNAVAHGRAKSCRISLAPSGGTVTLSIEDNGCGFDLTAVDHRGYGLRNIRERALEIGADLSIRARAGTGTTVMLVFALEGHDGSG